MLIENNWVHEIWGGNIYADSLKVLESLDFPELPVPAEVSQFS